MKVVASLALLLLPVTAWAGAAEKATAVGKKIPPITLRDFRGAERSLSEFTRSKAVVVAFIGTECPLAKVYGRRLGELAREYEPKGVAFVGVSSNQQDSVTALLDYAKGDDITFPILKDARNVVADLFGAQRTPEVYVLDPQGVVRYHGRIDDQYGVGFARPQPTRRDLARALDALLAGKPVEVAETDAPGCFIGRVKQEAKNDKVTYTKHIARILNNRCVECHHPGEIAPFSLTSYNEVIGWTDTIREVLEQNRMPPWHASPKYGHFANDSHMPEAEKKLVYEWIDNGCPEGDLKDLPPAPQYVTGWRIPKPDAVYTLPKQFKVPATGEVQYQYFIIDPGFTEDKWIRAAEVQPGCRSVVHHILVFLQTPAGNGVRKGNFGDNWLAAMAPGTRPTILGDGVAKFIPAGSRFLFQVHYTPDGVERLDRPRLGLVFADPKTVKKEVRVEAAANPALAIPPHDPNYRVDSYKPIDEDSYVLELMPHTHLRGKSFRYEAVYPDGKTEILLDLPRYDFNWQNTYVLAEPKFLPRGSQIHCVAYYDNSEKNRSNPNPDAEVHWGDQTWEEMMIGYFDVMPARQNLQEHPKHFQASLTPAKLDSELRDLAAHARDSKESWDAFAAAVHKAFPQVDRVCQTRYTGGALRVDQCSYPGSVSRQIMKAGFEGHSKAYALGFFALMGGVHPVPDLAKWKIADLGYMSATLGSSVHVAIALDGDPALVNFWSKQKNAFPKSTYATFKALAEAVASGQQTASR